MNLKKSPISCPDVDKFVRDAEQELQSLLRQEASLLGNIKRLKIQLNSAQQGIAANRQSIQVARDAITAYRQWLITEEEKEAETSKKEG